ncbi:MAG: hypothetical protein ACFFD9_04005, partial [Candidatus Thorarchaeota archaeon]
MRSTKRLVTVLLLALVLAGAMQAHPLALKSTIDNRARLDTPLSLVLAGFDSQNISVSLVGPTNNSGVSSTFNITLDIVSDFGILN